MLIEEKIVAYLNACQALETTPVPAYGVIPSPMPATFITVERTGGRSQNQLRSATIAVQCWAGSIDEAANLCAQVVDDMEGIISEPEIARCSLNAHYNFTDESTKRCRYQAVFDLVHYLN